MPRKGVVERYGEWERRRDEVHEYETFLRYTNYPRPNKVFMMVFSSCNWEG